ncbi:MAG TPA: hypothetical protein VJI46_05970 [Candidatus Nanoarchaeia archaeon]|nr:hypothetical protein [Candidatus Nanoarchaeia archaeon]
MRVLIPLLVLALILLAGCAKPLMPGEKKQPTAPVATVEPTIESVAEDISTTEQIDEDLSLEEFSDFEQDLASLDW